MQKTLPQCPRFGKKPHTPEILTKAANFAINFFSSGNYTPGTTRFWQFHFLECCDIREEYLLGETKIFSKSPNASGQFEWAASPFAVSLLSELPDRIASGFVGAYPDGIIARIKEAIESRLPSANLGSFAGTYSEDYTEEKRKDDCRGCPNDDTIWVGLQRVDGSITVASVDIPSYQIGGFGIPSVRISVLKGRMMLHKKGTLVSSYNKFEFTENKSLLLYAYQIGEGPVQRKWAILPVENSWIDGHDVCDR